VSKASESLLWWALVGVGLVGEKGVSTKVSVLQIWIRGVVGCLALFWCMEGLWLLVFSRGTSVLLLWVSVRWWGGGGGW